MTAIFILQKVHLVIVFNFMKGVNIKEKER